MFCGLLATGLAWRLYLGGFPGHQRDVLTFQMWAAGPADWPSQITPYFQSNYPPVYPSLLRVVGAAHPLLGLPGDLREPIGYRSMEASRPVIRTVKLLSILADIALAVLVFVAAGRSWRGVLLAGLVLFLPPLWYDSAYWGQTDTLLALVLGLMALFLARARLKATGVCAAAAILLKFQAVPALVIAAWLVFRRRRGRARRAGQVLTGSVVAALAVLALSAATGNLRQWRAGYAVVGDWPKTTVSAFNAWWLIDRPWDRLVYFRDFPPDDVPRLAGLTARQLGIVAWAATMVLIVFGLRRGRSDIAASAGGMAAAVLALFLLNTEMHERYAVPAVALCLLAAARDARWAALAIAAAVPIWLNCVAGLPWTEGGPETLMWWVNRAADARQDLLRTSVATANIVMGAAAICLVWMPRRRWRRRREGGLTAAAIAPRAG